MPRPHRGSRLGRRLRIRRRRIIRRTIEKLEHSHTWLPSWGTSVLAHLVALLILALLLLNSGAGREPPSFDATMAAPDQPIELELKSLLPSERSGDPFTKMQSTEAPSLTLNETSERIDLSKRPALPNDFKFNDAVGTSRISESEIAKLGKEIRVTNDARGGGQVLAGVHSEDLSAPFAGRDEDMKAKLLRREGGTVASEQAVAAGLEWMARHQRPDGSWGLDCSSQCVDPPCPNPTNAVSDTAATGLALLPMLGAGHVHTKKSRYQNVVKRGLDFLVAHQSEEGELYLGGGHNYRFYSHAIGTMALCEAYGLSKDPALRNPAQRAIYFLAKTQNLDDGGWRYFPGEPSDTSVMGWAVFALRSANLAGLDVPKRLTHGCRTYLDLAAGDPKMTVYCYMPGRFPTMTMTAEALLCRQYLGWPKDNSSLNRGVAYVYQDLKMNSQRNIYYWYYATQLLHNMGGKEWVEWNKNIRNGLVAMQVKSGGCDLGSWDPFQPSVDTWGRSAGRHYTTALSILTLEVYYRWLPLYRPVEGLPAGRQVEIKGAPTKPVEPAPADRTERPPAEAKR